MVRIDPTREKSIESEASDMADFKIFSGGSGQNNAIGSAEILYKKGKSGQQKHLPMSNTPGHILVSALQTDKKHFTPPIDSISWPIDMNLAVRS